MDLRLFLIALFCLTTTWGAAPHATAQPAEAQASAADTLALISLNEMIYTTYSSPNSFSPMSSLTSVSYSFRVGDGPEQSAGFMGEGLRPVLASNPEALAELDRFRSKRMQFVIGGAVLAAGVVTAHAVGINEPTGETVFDPRIGRDVEKSQINPVGLIPIGVGIVGLIYGGANYTGSSRHIQRAVAIYNDGKSGHTRTALAVALGFGSSGAGVRLSLSL